MGWLRFVVPFAILHCVAASANPGFIQVTSSCGGGFTGGSYGVTVHADGRIVRWHSPSFHEEPEEAPVKMDAALAGELLAELDRIGFADITHVEKADMTCSLEAHDGEESHVVSWPLGSPSVPEVQKIANRIQALLADSGAEGG